MWSTIKKYIYEWILTFSQKSSLLSSKKLERFSFISVSEFIILGTFFYLIHKGILTSTDAIVLISPLLLASGYNLNKTEEEKQNNKEEEKKDAIN